MKSTFFRLVRATDKADALLAACAAASAARSHADVFRLDARQFEAIPSSPFAYWAPVGVRLAFSRFPTFESEGRSVKQGISTADDFRFIRVWWESPLQLPIVKGGRSSAFYAPIRAMLRWKNDGAEAKAWNASLYGGGHWSRNLRNIDLFGTPGLTWPLRGVRFAAAAVPAGCAFSVGGKLGICPVGLLSETLGLTNSLAFDRLIGTGAGKVGGVQYEVGLISRMPVPTGVQREGRGLADLADRAWNLKRSLDTITETSHAFHLPALLQIHGNALADLAVTWSGHVTQVESELATIQAEIDDIAFHLYGIDGEDRARIEVESGTTPAPVATDDDADDAADATVEPDAAEPDDDDDTSSADASTLATELLSWSIGVAFGRFDLRLATSERPAPVEPGPFDALPARSPGMSPDDALAVDFLVDDPGHPLDLGARVADVFARVFGTDSEARLDEAVRLAGSPDLPTFLRRTFFPFHLKRYSKSRRKAPIWWPLSTASGTYTVWLAWPRLTRDTLFRVADEIKRQKLPFETRKLASLKQEHGPNPTTRQRADIAAQEDLVSELTALLEEVERVAPMWNPVHDDGVILHYTLLWRIVRDAAWQKECRAAWEKLAKGDYDWAHIAMHLWPERVAPKCRTDRSLAIAHGLEDTFWVEIAGKWRARDNTDAALVAAIAARTSPAVKAALRAFTDAPAPGRGGRGKKGA